MTATPSTQPKPTAAPDALAVDAEALAKLLCLSVRSIRRLDSAGKLPKPLRIGSAVRWKLHGPDGIRAWLAAGCPDRRTWNARRTVEGGGG